jgi:hypothetical protein
MVRLALRTLAVEPWRVDRARRPPIPYRASSSRPAGGTFPMPTSPRYMALASRRLVEVARPIKTSDSRRASEERRASGGDSGAWAAASPARAGRPGEGRPRARSRRSRASWPRSLRTLDAARSSRTSPLGSRMSSAWGAAGEDGIGWPGRSSRCSPGDITSPTRRGTVSAKLSSPRPKAGASWNAWARNQDSPLAATPRILIDGTAVGGGPRPVPRLMWSTTLVEQASSRRGSRPRTRRRSKSDNTRLPRASEGRDHRDGRGRNE